MQDQEHTQRPQALTKSGRGLVKLGFLVALVIVALIFIPKGTKDIKTGECFTGDPNSYPANATKINCAKATLMDYKIVLNEDIQGDYPGNIADIRSRCTKGSGSFYAPIRMAWSHGDKAAICIKNAKLSR
jgi:hypothetical protein